MPKFDFKKAEYFKYVGGRNGGLKIFHSPGDHRPKFFITQSFFQKIFQFS